LVPQEPVRFKHPAANPGVAKDSPQLDLKVIFTDLPKTAAALAAARAMARGLSAHITVMAAQVVPYPLPLADPDVPVEFTERMLKSIAVEDTSVEIYLCRDRNETIRRALPPDSLVIVGARKWRWWPSWERHLAKVLRHDGRRVVVVTV
jgi:hypothetical protein